MFSPGDEVDTAPVHYLLLPKGYLCIENMNTNVDELPPSGAEVYNFPMRLNKGTGAPTRFYALTDQDRFNDACGIIAQRILVVSSTMITFLVMIMLF